MGYALEHTAWEDLPLSEQIGIATMQAQIRDNQLTDAEESAKGWATDDARAERAEHLRSIGHPSFADPVLQVGESKHVTVLGRHYLMTRTQ
jgi:hypothetical protein